MHGLIYRWTLTFIIRCNDQTAAYRRIEVCVLNVQKRGYGGYCWLVQNRLLRVNVTDYISPMVKCRDNEVLSKFFLRFSIESSSVIKLIWVAWTRGTLNGLARVPHPSRVLTPPTICRISLVFYLNVGLLGQAIQLETNRCPGCDSECCSWKVLVSPRLTGSIKVALQPHDLHPILLW